MCRRCVSLRTGVHAKQRICASQPVNTSCVSGRARAPLESRTGRLHSLDSSMSADCALSPGLLRIDGYDRSHIVRCHQYRQSCRCDEVRFQPPLAPPNVCVLPKQGVDRRLGACVCMIGDSTRHPGVQRRVCVCVSALRLLFVSVSDRCDCCNSAFG